MSGWGEQMVSSPSEICKIYFMKLHILSQINALEMCVKMVSEHIIQAGTSPESHQSVYFTLLSKGAMSYRIEIS